MKFQRKTIYADPSFKIVRIVWYFQKTGMDEVKLYHKMSRCVAKAIAKATAKNDTNYYSTFSKSLGKYEGYRYIVGALLAQHELQFTSPPLEVGVGRIAATKFHNEQQRWPEYPFTVDRIQCIITEV
jgi:hypothetical protein